VLPGPQSRTWFMRYAARQAPMGPRSSGGRRSPSIVLSQGKGCNVLDVDGNRYVDLAAGFGSLLLGHAHSAVLRAIEIQSGRLMQGLGDVYPSDAKIGLLDRLARLHPDPSAQVILGQSGADAITAALKTAVLATGKTAVLAFKSAYHGLSYGALGVSDLRPSYREPFVDHLARDVRFVPYPASAAEAQQSLDECKRQLADGRVGAVLIEPILGRGGVVCPPAGFLTELSELARLHGALLIADEIWTGLGRAGFWLSHQREAGFFPDLICLGKGLGGGLPISACVGRGRVMQAWSCDQEVVHTSTFAGAPLACTAALATLDVLSRHGLIESTRSLGQTWINSLRELLRDTPITDIRGSGLMIGIDATQIPGGAGALQRALLERGFITTTGGGRRDVLVLTPPLIINHDLWMAFEDALRLVVRLITGK
ncbi:MAG TPA: aspartate aminotransferase family protein, partial [Polyangiaceae bacterium]|nr:aspartate aminotransferase family protein [Polyangiaceae bacterium]